MTKMKKIVVEKDATIADVIQAIADDQDPELTLVIPKETVLRESIANFQILKREANVHGKKGIVESVDEEVLALADACGLEASHPLFAAGQKVRSLTDIVPVDVVSAKGSAKRGAKKKAGPGPLPQTLTSVPATPVSPRKIAAPKTESIKRSEPVPAQESFVVHAVEMTPAEEPEEKPRRRFSRKALYVAAAIVVALIPGVWAVNVVFGRATVTLNFTKSSWQYQGALAASKGVREPDIAKNLIPAEVFYDQRNLTQLFPATGKAKVSEKAKGTITVYNAYSSAAQGLVATTRFATAAGKVYRLDRAITVPGAEIKDGKIIPASIDAAVSADQAGASYNIASSTEQLTIPGFKNTPKYAGFYGVVKGAITGGFVGEKAVPTDADIAAAKARVTELLTTSLKNNMLSKRPEDFVFVDGATEVSITKITPNKTTDENGNFGVFGEAWARAIGFKGADMEAALTALASKDHPGAAFRDWQAAYSAPKPDFDHGELRFTFTAQGTLAQEFSPAEFTPGIVGKSLGEARSAIVGLPGLADAKISVWPIWLRHLPNDARRVTIVVN